MSISSISLNQENISIQKIGNQTSHTIGSAEEQWIMEWTGEKGRKEIMSKVRQALPVPVEIKILDLVVRYLQKSDVFGLAKLENVMGGPSGLKELLGPYEQEKPLPPDIDDLMQAPLSRYFSAEFLEGFHEGRGSGWARSNRISKITELYSLYWCPKGVTAIAADQIATKCNTKVCNPLWKFSFKEFVNTPTPFDCWIAFPNDVFGRGRTVPEQESLIPASFEFPQIQEALFCVFMKYACTQKRILPTTSTEDGTIGTWTLCKEEFLTHQNSLLGKKEFLNKLCVGGFGDSGVNISYVGYSIFGRDTTMALAPIRKFN